MFRCSSTALAFAAATIFLPLNAHAKPGASLHPTIPHAFAPAAGMNHPRFTDHHKIFHGFHKFSHHHHHHHHDGQFFAWGLPYTFGDYPLYGSYYDPSDATAVDPASVSEPGPFTGSIRPRAFYRTGCRSEDVSVPSAHGQTTVTVTRCSVPILESPPLK
jgi:hypothetical protein